MKPNIDLARLHLALADRDIKAFQILASAAGVADASAGFHAQQAAEKCLKAVLIYHGIEFRKTHDLAELLDLLTDNRRPLPPYSESLDELNPYAVEFRYGLVEPQKLDRAKAEKMLAAVRAWAEAQIQS